MASTGLPSADSPRGLTAVVVERAHAATSASLRWSAAGRRRRGGDRGMTLICTAQIAIAVMEAGMATKTMATKTTAALEDDLDGGPADETLRSGLGRPGARDRPEREARRGVPSAARSLHRACPPGWQRTAPPGGACLIKP